MGTRSIIRFKERRGEEVREIAAVYQQFDGYLSGVGEKLCTFLESGKIVNGITPRRQGAVFNGMGCLAAQFVADQKDGAGGLYLHAPGCEDEECNYEVEGGYEQASGWDMTILPLVVRYSAYGEEFTGSVDEFRAYIASEQSRAEE